MSEHSRRQVMECSRRGSALILVLLILLALSAIGMVALKNITRSLDQSGQFRARNNARALADGAAHFVGKQFGDNAQRYLGGMQHLQDLERDGEIDRGGGGTSSRQMTDRGKYQEFEQYPGEPNAQDFSDVLQISNNGDVSESGLFYDGTHASFESSEGETGFEVIVRDPLSGFPIPGFENDEYCFTRVTIAARGEVGNRGGDWDATDQTGVGTGMFEAMVGPSQNCGG